MRTLLVVLSALLAAPATAAAAFTASGAVPVFDAEIPRAVAWADGRGVVISQAGGQPYSQATQYTTTLPARKRTTFTDTEILDTVSRQDGGVDLLVRRGSDPTKRADITLRRVLPTGKIYDLWSIRTSATTGALARGKDRTFVAWPEGSVLKLVTRPDGGIPTKPHNARIGLRGCASTSTLRSMLAARLVAAAQTGSSGLVVAALRSIGSVLQRQTRSKVSGLVQLAVTSRGRVGLLVEDTGIEGEGGECVADGQGRHIRVLVRERDAARFGATQTIESPRFGCGSGGALLRALPGDGLVAIYQGGSYDFPPLAGPRRDGRGRRGVRSTRHARDRCARRCRGRDARR